MVPCFPLLGLTPSGLFMGLSSTIIYTSELILCSTICVPSATRHNIHLYPTLGEFGFSKKVCHRDGEVDVIIPEFVEEKEIVKGIQCLHCSDKFVKKISASDCS